MQQIPNDMRDTIIRCAIANYAFFGSEPEWDLPQEIRVLLAVAKPSIDAERNYKKA